LEELLVAYEKSRDKGGSFTYRYLFLPFAMLKRTPHVRRPLVPMDKGRLEKMFDPWNSRADLEKYSFNNTTFSKWYNILIDATKRLCIPQELINCNTQNITFNMNHHHTFVWLRYANREEFHLCMLLFYLDEEALDKEVMSWPRVKHNPHNLGMHYVFPAEMLNKKG
jgi:hypothetical protein